MSAVTIRKADDGDVRAIAELELCCFTDPWSEASIESALDAESVHTVVAEEEGVVVGYGFISVVADECEVLNLAVAPSMRRRGIGEELLSEMLSHGAKFGAVTSYLEVRRSNDGAIRLYENAGFSAIGIRKNYYRYPTEDAVIMAAKLSVPGDCNDNLSD